MRSEADPTAIEWLVEESIIGHRLAEIVMMSIQLEQDIMQRDAQAKKLDEQFQRGKIDYSELLNGLVAISEPVNDTIRELQVSCKEIRRSIE